MVGAAKIEEARDVLPVCRMLNVCFCGLGSNSSRVERNGMKHVFIVGSKGIPASYGGFETFVEKLTEYQQTRDIKYHVACAVDDMPLQPEFEYNGAHCFCVKWRPIGAARAITYDLDALSWCLDYIEKHKISEPVVYVLACRIGPFIGAYAKRLHKMGGALLVNPDGHEWLRAKWSTPVRKYWKLSESGMVKNADLLVCDSRTIESYIKDEYVKYRPQTTYIAYGADLARSTIGDDDSKWLSWLTEHALAPDNYYLVVGRFVPENNYETMIREFMLSDTDRDFVLVTGVDERFLEELQSKIDYRSDSRIKFVGTIYDSELLKKVRENAFAYFHGHEVGGTNPSLLEALSLTKLNLLLDVEFNHEVARDSALYWKKDKNSLSNLIEKVETMEVDEIRRLEYASTAEIMKRFSWSQIVAMYETLFHTL